MRRLPSAAVSASAALLLLLCAAPADAHGAANPPRQWSRLLHDYSDDWGGDSGNAYDGHDLIALDLREAYDPGSGRDELVFRLILNGGYGPHGSHPVLVDDLSFTVNGTVEHHPFTTTDNQRFTGAFDDVAGPFPQLTADGHPDGTRFYVEGRLRLPNGSLQVGATLEGFFVQGKAGSADADHMVGGFTKDGVRTDEMPPSEQADGASYRRPDYRIQGPIQYLTSQLASRSIAPGTASSQALSWTITSRLDEPQNVTLTTLGADAGVTFHTSQASGATLTVLLAAREAASIEVIVASHAGGQEAPTLVASTDLGGRQLERLAFADATSSASATGSSPGPGTVLALGGLVLVAVARRRRTDA